MLRRPFFYICLLFPISVYALFLLSNKGYSFPESVIRYRDHLYVTGDGNIPAPVAKNGDGVIQQLSLKGHLIAPNISKLVLHSPKGTAIIHDVIYVADIDRIVGISLITGDMETLIDFSGRTVLLNDIAVKDSNTLFVSATDINKVFKVTLHSPAAIEQLQIPDIAGANGLYYEKISNTLYVAGFGSPESTGPVGIIGRITWSESGCHYDTVFTQKGYYDGIQMKNAHTLLVSNWKSLQKPCGSIMEIGLSGNKGRLMKEIPVCGAPADFYYDQQTQQLFIPLALQNSFKVIKLND